MIKVVDLTQHYGVRPVLRGVNLEVQPGELLGLMGPNGMGKSTLLAAMAGVLSPQKGHVEIDGKQRRSSPENEAAIRKQVLYLPDHPWLPMFRTGREFLLAVGDIYEVDDERLFDHVERLLKLFDLEEKADSPIRSYSSGQQKKIAICAALVTDAPILLLDEPFSGGLDPAAILALKKVLKRLADREDVTVVMATPVPEIVEGLAHRVAILRRGEIAACDPPDGLRKLTNCDGPLEVVLEHLISPQTLDNIENYFAEDVP
ncbi:MAG TPA: ABC transporter ATP-binding protein [Candidatus Hydrogenedentes bacterium]|nr:ABC transporter ATP-binding protein [Candidatus Hydrogenedentota bacterium]